MVGTRHLQGTIISRVGYLLESGSLKKPPIWYDIVRRFPPPKTSVLSLVGNVDHTEVPKILYPVDDIKREFHQKFNRAIRDPECLFNEVTVEETKTELFLKDYNNFIQDGCSHEEAMTKSSELFTNHLQSLRDKKQGHTSRQEWTFEDANSGEPEGADMNTDDIYEMFSSKTSKK